MIASDMRENEMYVRPSDGRQVKVLEIFDWGFVWFEMYRPPLFPFLDGIGMPAFLKDFIPLN